MLLYRCTHSDDSDDDGDDSSVDNDEVCDQTRAHYVKNASDDVREEQFVIGPQQPNITDTKPLKQKKTRASKRKKINPPKSKGTKPPKSSQPKGKYPMEYDTTKMMVTTDPPICASWNGGTMLSQHHYPRKRIRHDHQLTAAVDQSVATFPVQCFDNDQL